MQWSLERDTCSRTPGVCLRGQSTADILVDQRRADTILRFCCDPQVVAFQATLELMAREFPGAFSGYKLEVTESHQRQKADTSGTAKAVVASIARLGAPITEVRVQGFSCFLTTLCRAMMTQINGTIAQGMVCNHGCDSHVLTKQSNALTCPEAAALQMRAGMPARL